jgi:phosphate transport system substrate-binding protein
MRTIHWVGLVIVFLGLGCGESSTLRLDGAGSSFIDPVMQEWAQTYEKRNRVELNYQARGSGAGIQLMTNKEVDFGCTDAPLTEEQIEDCLETHGEVLHIPLAMGAVVIAYNLEELPQLVFDGGTLVGIFTGKITQWNDPALARLNPDVVLPEEKITVAFRSDASGTSYIFTDYCAQIAPDTWSPGKGTAPAFKVGSGHKGNSGVAGAIKSTRGAIGYVEYIYALKNDLPFGALINARGQVVRPSLKSVTEAAQGVELPDDLRFSMVNAPGEGAYPLAGTVWAIVYARQPTARGKALKDFLWWATHEGQFHLEALHYARLPAALVKKIEDKLAKLS